VSFDRGGADYGSEGRHNAEKPGPNGN